METLVAGVLGGGGSHAVLFAIPCLPLAGAIINAIFGRRLQRSTVAFIACGVMGVAFALGLASFIEVVRTGPRVAHGFEWLVAGNFQVSVRLLFDNLSGVMTLVVTGVGFLIHVYSVGYMAHDAGFARYFTYLNLFAFAMLMLVLGDSLPVMFVGWEGVGLCSYLLIGFWFEDAAKASAGKKAFITNRVGDAGFLLAIFYIGWLFAEASPARNVTLSYAEMQANVATLAPHATAIALLLFVGAIGKSAQLPLHFWLPDAMAGPTPVSALIHAATMVTAGVYMVARLGFLYSLSATASAVVAGVGAVTAFFAATVAMSQTDIKKVLAFSTVSQLGFMFLAVGVGAYAAGVFHLMTHAFFKACLFLGAGSVIHAMSGEQDIRKMGGLWSKLPWTGKTFLIATLAIAGAPPLAGFVSKDEILGAAFHAHLPGAPVFFGLALATTGLTAFYMFRLFFMVFTGPASDGAAHAHESPRTMTIPLIVLAGLAVVGGGFWPGLLPMGALLGDPHHLDFKEAIVPMLLGLALAAAGYFAAQGLYRGGASAQRQLDIPGVPHGGLGRDPHGVAPDGARVRAFAKRWDKLVVASREQWYVDHALGRYVPRLVMSVAFLLWRLVDFFVIDVIILGGLSAFAHGFGHLARLAQNGQVQRYATSMLVGVALILLVFLKCRTA